MCLSTRAGFAPLPGPGVDAGQAGGTPGTDVDRASVRSPGWRRLSLSDASGGPHTLQLNTPL